jgi:hypothetical protein
VKNQKMTLDLMIVTGGNAKNLIGYLKGSFSPLTIHHEEQLVLKGLLAWNKMVLAS